MPTCRRRSRTLGEAEDVTRRIYWLAVLTAAAAGAYVAYRLGLRARGRQIEPTGATGWISPYPGADGSDAWGAGAPGTGPPDAATREAPAEEVATVVATMEAPSSARVAQRYDGNGSPRITPLPADLSQPVQIPRRRGLSAATLAGVATVVGLAAIGLGAWAVVLGVNGDSSDAPDSAVELRGVQEVVSLLSRPTTERIPLQGSAGRIILVVGARGYGVLVLDGLTPAPAGRTYQAWVIRPNADAPQSAAVFSGTDVIVPLATAVPPGAAVAITLERAGGAPAPTQKPKLVATRAT